MVERMEHFKKIGDLYFDAFGHDITDLVHALESHQRRVHAGEQTSPAKARAARRNGKKGGRPKGSKNRPKEQTLLRPD
jgi:hypothetical protein